MSITPDFESDIVTYLTTTLGLTNVTKTALAPTPKIQTAVVEYYGMGTKTHTTTATPSAMTKLDEGWLQIQVRDVKNADAKTRIYAIVDALDGLQNVTIGGRVYTYFTQISRPRLLAHEEDGTVVWIFEVQAQARRP